MDWFVIKKLVAAALLPPGSIIVLLCLSLVLLRRKANTGFVLVAATTIALYALSIGPVVSWLIEPLERTPALALTEARLADRQAIVVLGAGRRSYAPEFGGETVSSLSLERVRYGAWLQKRLQLPLLVAGGVTLDGGAPEAELMAGVLRDEYSVPVRWLETRSRTTRDNAEFSRELLGSSQITRIVLVSHAIHLPRAEKMFTDHGFDVLLAPTSFLSYGLPSEIRLHDFLPSAIGLWRSWYALHEHVGRLWYWLRS